MNSPETVEKLAEELVTCADISAKLDEHMLQIRNRISGDGTDPSEA